MQLPQTQLVTQPEREPNVGTEREIGGRDRGGASGCHAFGKKKNHWHTSAAMETYLVTAPAPLRKLPQP